MPRFHYDRGIKSELKSVKCTSEYQSSDFIYAKILSILLSYQYLFLLNEFITFLCLMDLFL